MTVDQRLQLAHSIIVSAGIVIRIRGNIERQSQVIPDVFAFFGAIFDFRFHIPRSRLNYVHFLSRLVRTVHLSMTNQAADYLSASILSVTGQATVMEGAWQVDPFTTQPRTTTLAATPAPPPPRHVPTARAGDRTGRVVQPARLQIDHRPRRPSSAPGSFS